jgi:hypothetical protein
LRGKSESMGSPAGLPSPRLNRSQHRVDQVKSLSSDVCSARPKGNPIRLCRAGPSGLRAIAKETRARCQKR